MEINFLFHSFQESGEKIESMSKKDAAMFPIIASCTLFGLYVFFKVIKSGSIFVSIIYLSSKTGQSQSYGLNTSLVNATSEQNRFGSLTCTIYELVADSRHVCHLVQAKWGDFLAGHCYSHVCPKQSLRLIVQLNCSIYLVEAIFYAPCIVPSVSGIIQYMQSIPAF